MKTLRDILDLPVSSQFDTLVTGQHQQLSHSTTRTVRDWLRLAEETNDARYDTDNQPLDQTMTVRALLDWHTDYDRWSLSDENETYTVSRLHRNDAGLVYDADALFTCDFDSTADAIRAIVEDAGFDDFPAVHDIEIYCQFTGHTVVGYYLNGEFHIEFDGDRKDAEATILAEA